ncbi:hypothetical protein RHMOL_Rhmol06G0059400 [Rhododendron molle]|uniref:Uncharacterized protein n=1 Tax=Rhododendron molle TaxID=49168 RepID=A0ACC0NAQ9_RHOML|nr:hypothetical protein RHMOL_Rhmol06G0059400 [Rhododendron molle]
MGSIKPEVSQEVLPYLIEYKDGTVERLVGTQVTPPGSDPQTGVVSKDVLIVPETGVSVRLYRPIDTPKDKKLPLVVYFHGGAFCIATVGEPLYHNSLNILVANSNVVAVSVDFRNSPEFPLPAAYDDSWAALEWVASHAAGGGPEVWLNENVDFDKVYLAGDSAGANISHHMAIRAGSTRINGLKFRGILMIQPYFWGEKPIGSEVTDTVRKGMVDIWWRYVCPSDKGCDDPLINPFADGSPCLSGLACDRVIVCVAEKDILRDRGVLYYDALVKSGWGGKVEFDEVEGEDHVFHLFNPTCEKAVNMIKRLARFINEESEI